MSHLDPERLASLADDEPTTFEAKHLAACAACARERDAYIALAGLARAERAVVGVGGPAGAPLSSWERLAPQLREAGLLRDALPMHVGGGVGRFGSRWWMQAAAAVALTLGGVLAGRATAGYSLRAGAAPAQTASTSSASRAQGAQQGAQQGTQLVANSDTLVRFTSVADAQRRLSQAEREYRQAMEFLALNDTTTRTVTASDVYRARLAALDAMAGAARTAVDEVPHDPVINQYYLSTLAAREATLRQLGTTLPKGVSLVRY